MLPIKICSDEEIDDINKNVLDEVKWIGKKHGMTASVKGGKIIFEKPIGGGINSLDVSLFTYMTRFNSSSEELEEWVVFWLGEWEETFNVLNDKELMEQLKHAKTSPARDFEDVAKELGV